MILPQTSVKINQLVFCNCGLLEYEALDHFFQEVHVCAWFAIEAVSFFVFFILVGFLVEFLDAILVRLLVGIFARLLVGNLAAKLPTKIFVGLLIGILV